jgi:AcrR family transcriptional regulator
MMAVIAVEDQDSDDVRTRMVRAAATLIGARGVSATSFADVLEASGAPRGSIYHHFPGGKRQLVAEAVDWTSEQVQGHQRACDATAPTGVIEHFVDLRRSRRLSDCRPRHRSLRRRPAARRSRRASLRGVDGPPDRPAH